MSLSKQTFKLVARLRVRHFLLRSNIARARFPSKMGAFVRVLVIIIAMCALHAISQVDFAAQAAH